VAIDLLERLTGVAPPWTPYDRYPERARQQKAEGKTRPAPADRGSGGLRPGDLTRPMGEYTGWFHHPHLGTLIVERRDGGLRLQLGDAALDAFAGDTKDQFTLEGQFDPPARCRFIVKEGGDIEEIHVQEEDLGLLVFHR
jgi:hypothetical protein